MTDQDNTAKPAESAGMEIPSEYIQDGKILGRFESPQQMLNAFATGEAAPAVEAEPQTAQIPTAPALSGDLKIEAPVAQDPVMSEGSLMDLYAESQGDGISDDRFAQLESRGIDRATVELAIDGINARRELARGQVFEAVGGQEVVDQAFAWAQSNMTEAQVNSINADLATASVDTQAAIIRGLVQQSGATSYAAGSGSQNPGTVPFASKAQFQEAIADPRYKTDPAYREEVARRLGQM